MIPLDTVGKKIFTLMSALHAGCIQSRQAERSVSAVHFSQLSLALVESLDLCENGYDAAMTMLRTRDMQAAFSMVELIAAAPTAISIPSTDGSAAKTALRGLHEAIRTAWLDLASTLSGSEALSATAFATSHGALVTRFGVTNGSPEIP